MMIKLFHRILSIIFIGILCFDFVVCHAQNKKNFSGFYLGFELSELLQNHFKNIGSRNFTIFAGQDFQEGKFDKFGYRLLFINVDLSHEHLVNNQFISGDKNGLSGHLLVSKLALDYYFFDKSAGFFNFRPVLSVGPGFSQTKFLNAEEYRLNAFFISTGIRLQYMFFNRIFLEFPVADFCTTIYKNRSSKGTIGNTTINYPEWGMIFLWINMGFRF